MRGAPQSGFANDHLPDEPSDVGADLRPAAARTRSACPVPREAAAMPGDDRRGLDHHQGRLPVPPYPSQYNPEQSIEATNGGLRSRTPIDSQLLMQRQVFEDQSAVPARENDQEPNNVDDPGDHQFSITGSAPWPRP